MAETYVTRAGLAKLQDEHRALQQQKVQLTEEVSKAAGMGDLRENAEYQAARERLQHVSARLAELDAKLGNVRLIEEVETKSGEARVGTQVMLEDEQTHERFSYQLVGPEEADPASGKLSIASPLGKQLLGKKAGEHFTLTLPRSTAAYHVISVERPGA